MIALRRIWWRCGRLPLFRLGLSLVLLGQGIDALDALMGLDLTALLPHGYNVARIVALLGLLKIALRGVFVVVSALRPREGTQ